MRAIFTMILSSQKRPSPAFQFFKTLCDTVFFALTWSKTKRKIHSTVCQLFWCLAVIYSKAFSIYDCESAVQLGLFSEQFSFQNRPFFVSDDCQIDQLQFPDFWNKVILSAFYIKIVLFSYILAEQKSKKIQRKLQKFTFSSLRKWKLVNFQ